MKEKIIIAIGISVIFLTIMIMSITENVFFAKGEEESLKHNANETPQDEIEARPEVKDYFLPLTHSEKRFAPISHVMLHFSSNVTAKPEDPFRIEDIYAVFDDYGVSAHYVIDRKGEIYRFVREERVAYHAGAGKLDGFPEYENELNNYSIGIELLAIGTKEEMAAFVEEEVYDELASSYIGYTEEQYQALEVLLNDIYERNPEIKQNRKHVMGHDEYAPDRKNDPGALFDWSKIGY